MDIALILGKIRPNAKWRMSGTYEQLKKTWEDEEQSLPSLDEIIEAWEKLTTITLDELKIKKWAEIKALRDKIEQSGCPFKDTFIDSDLISVSRINVACIAAQAALSSGQEFSIDWTMKDNSTRKLSAVEVIEMSSALASWSNTCHEKGRLLREQIEAATTVEDLEKIKW